MRRNAVSLMVLAVALSGCAVAARTVTETAPQTATPSYTVPEASRAHPALWPHAASPAALSDARAEAFVADLMGRMTVEEKVGQLIQADISAITPDDLLTYPLGSILAGGNSGPWGDDKAPAQKWLDLARAFREANARRGGTVVPLIYGIDAVHGHNNVPGATIFPAQHRAWARRAIPT